MSHTPKKFALVGTSCVGKTTLINLVYKQLQNTKPELIITMVPEAARIYFSTKKTNNPFSFLHQKNIQNLALTLEKNAHKENPDLILCDRSIIDAIAYRHAINTTDNKLEYLKRHAFPWIHTYSHIFLLSPLHVPYQTDSIRKESIHFRNKFHESFLTILPLFPLSFSIIDDKTIEKRIHSITSTVKTHLL